MPDNVSAEAVVNPGATFATDDDAGVHHPYAKLEWGADGTFTKVTAGAGALPIQDGGNSITVDGNVGVAGGSVGLLSGALHIGSVTVDDTVIVNGAVADGAAIGGAGNPILIAGFDGTNVQTLRTNAFGSLEVSTITTSVAPGTGAAHLGKAVDGVAGVTDTGILALAVRDDALETLTPIDGDYAQLRVTSTGRLWVSATIDSSLAAGSNVIGTIVNGGAGKTLKRAVVALTNDGDVVALVSTKRIKVYAYEIQVSADGLTVQFRSNNASGAQLGIPWLLNTREGVMGSSVDPPHFLFATVAGEAFFAIINGTGTANISVSYWDDDLT